MRQLSASYDLTIVDVETWSEVSTCKILLLSCKMSAEEREKGKIAGYLAERFTRVKSEFAMILSL